MQRFGIETTDMGKIKLILLLLLISTSLLAQNGFKGLDFYEKKIEQFPKNSDSIAFYANKILTQAKASNSKKETCIANRYFAEAAFIEGRDKEAVVFLNKAFSCFENVVGVEEDKADCYRLLARIETLDKKYDLAYEHLSKAKLLYKKVGKLKRPDSNFFLSNNIAYLYILTEKYDKALEILNANQKHHVSDLVLANIYSLFSIIANEQGDFKESIKYFKQTKIIYEKLNETNAALICEMNITINYYYLKNYKVAITGLNKVLKKANKIKTQPSVFVRIHLFLSMCYFEQGEYDIADVYFNKAEAIIAKGNLDFLSFQNIWLENKVTFLIHKKKYTEAKELLVKYLNEDNEILNSSKIAFYKLLKTIAKETNNSSELKRYNDSISEFKLEDELNNQKSVIDLMRAEFKYNTVEKELELKNKEFELLKIKERNNQIVLIFLVCIGVLSIVFFSILYSRKKKINAMREAIFEKEKQYFESVNHQKLLEIEYKDKEIVGFAIHISEKNEILNTIKSRLKELTTNDYPIQSKIKDLILFINNTISQNSEKVTMYSEAEEIKELFLQKIKIEFPDLTDKEIRVAILVKMQLTSKQIGQQLNITPASVDNYRSVLRRKMNIPKEKTLLEFLNEIV